MRLYALDSVRGIAAVSVVIYHSLLVWPELHAFLDGRGVPYAVNGDIKTLMLTVTPPSLLWSGREAVLLFFVLSGFVLALGFEGDAAGRPGWREFMAKRAVRLLLPCTAVTLMLAMLVPMVDPSPKQDLSKWFNDAWTQEVTPALVLEHALLFAGDYNLNSPMWTLQHELRISLLFPLVMLLVAAGIKVLSVATAAAVLAALIERKLIGTDLLSTLLYVPYFALGALLARHRGAMAAVVPRFGRAAWLALWILCYLLLTFRWLVPARGLICDFANGAGAALLIALILGSPRVQTALECRPLPWLGAISYSLYLVHVPVLLMMLHLADDTVPTWLVATAAPLLSVPVAWLLHRAVERPSIGLARRIGRWVGARRRAADGDGGLTMTPAHPSATAAGRRSC